MTRPSLAAGRAEERGSEGTGVNSEIRRCWRGCCEGVSSSVEPRDSGTWGSRLVGYYMGMHSLTHTGQVKPGQMVHMAAGGEYQAVVYSEGPESGVSGKTALKDS